MLSGMPGFRPASIASLTRLAAPLTASDTSSIVDFDSGTGSRPSYTNGGGGMSSAIGKTPDREVVIDQIAVRSSFGVGRVDHRPEEGVDGRAPPLVNVWRPRALLPFTEDT